MVRGWNPSGGKIFHAHQEFPWGRAAGAWFTSPLLPSLAPKLKKEWSCTSAAPQGLLF